MIGPLCCCCCFDLTLLFRKVDTGGNGYGVQITFSYLSKTYNLWIDLPTIPYFSYHYVHTYSEGCSYPPTDYWSLRSGTNCGLEDGFVYISVNLLSWNDYKVLTDFNIPLSDCYYSKSSDSGACILRHTLGYQVVNYQGLMTDFEFQIKEKLNEKLLELGGLYA